VGVVFPAAVAVAAAALSALAAAPACSATCPGAGRVEVPGAEYQERHCLDDMSTSANQASGRTDRSDWSGLHARGTRNPPGVAGLQVEGYFPDDSTTNTWQARNHDSQFVIRLPNAWNGKLVVTGAPGVRRQYANDFIISDWVTARGYAFASTDKGNTGTSFYRDGERPGDAVAEWHRRVGELTRAAQEVVRRRYGRSAARTYVTGISNGGYLARYALENSPELYDGGVDWEGTLMRADGPNLLTFLPPAIRNYAAWKRGDEAAHRAILEAGFEPGSEFLWDYHEAVYWDLTQRIYREEFDPGYDGDQEAGTPFCQSGVPRCDADYDYARRPAAVKDAVRRVENTGRIGRPMLTLHGTLDALLPIRRDSHVYADLVRAAGRGGLHRYYVIEQGNHVDSLYDDHPDRLRPILPCYRAAFLALERWVERGVEPPPAQFVRRPRTGDVVNTCGLAGGAQAGGGDPGGPQGYGGPVGAAPRSAARGLRVRVRPRRDRRRPWVFRTRGRLLLPAGMSREQGCGSGRVSVRVRVRGRTISSRRARLRSDCTFRSRVRFRAGRRLGRGRLRFVVRFGGNDAVAPVRARSRVVRVRLRR
jgi:hypothetical protein